MNLPCSDLIIVADKNIPGVRDAFNRVGVLRLLDSNEITPLSVADCDILLVRYVTRVNKTLLTDSHVKFVGTFSAGTDHIHLEYLKSRNIGFSAAPGSNSESVAEYVTAALLRLHRQGKIRIPGSVLGVVGAGNVGSRVAQKAKALGIRVLLNDPSKRRDTGDKVYRPLSELVRRADVITLHTPLTFAGRDKTAGLFGAARLSKLKFGSVIINTARGGIIHEGALKAMLASGRIGGAVLDVWQNEPDIDQRLVRMADIATPHVAGLSQEARSNALAMVYKDVCSHLGIDGGWYPQAPNFSKHVFSDNWSKMDHFDAISSIVSQVYDIEKDSKDFRRLASKTPIGVAFTSFRKRYIRHTEFGSCRIKLSETSQELARVLRQLGFRTL